MGVLYCPHWSNKAVLEPGECRWSYDSNGKTGQDYLKTHLRINHKGQAVPAAAGPVLPPVRVKRQSLAVPARLTLPADAPIEVAPKRRRDAVTREQVIAAIQAAAAENGGVPISISRWKREKRTPSHGVFYGLFDSYPDALRAAGFDAVDRPAPGMAHTPSSGRAATVEGPGPDRLDDAITPGSEPEAPTAAEGTAAEARPEPPSLLRYLVERCSVVDLREMRDDAQKRADLYERIALEARSEAGILEAAIEHIREAA